MSSLWISWKLSKTWHPYRHFNHHNDDLIPIVIARPICWRNLGTVPLMKIDRKWRRTVKPWMKSYIRYAMLDRGERLSLAWKCHFSLVVTVRPREMGALWEPISPTIYIRQCDYLTSITYENRNNWSKNYDRDRWQLNFFKNLKQVTPKCTFLNHTTLFKQRDQASPRNERALIHGPVLSLEEPHRQGDIRQGGSDADLDLPVAD